MFLVKLNVTEKPNKKNIKETSDQKNINIEELKKKIQKAISDLNLVDKVRKKEFKQHEIEKEYERRKTIQVYKN